jgi:peptide/nickel transport system permease protein
MLKYALKRFSVAILVAITVSLITFSMIYLSGDPAMALAGETATQQDIESIRNI